MGSKLTKKDLDVLYEYAHLQQEKVPYAMKRAIMKVYGYSVDDPYLAQKVWSRKKALLKSERVHELFLTAGVDKLEVAHKIKELMDAENPIIYKGQISTDENGDPITIPDLRTQLAATGLAANVLGLQQKQTSVDLSKRQSNLIVIVEDKKSARERIEQAVQATKAVVQESYTVEEETESETDTE